MVSFQATDFEQKDNILIGERQYFDCQHMQFHMVLTVSKFDLEHI